MVTLFSIEPTVIIVVLLNLLFWVGVCFLLYHFFRKKKK